MDDEEKAVPPSPPVLRRSRRYYAHIEDIQSKLQVYFEKHNFESFLTNFQDAYKDDGTRIDLNRPYFYRIVENPKLFWKFMEIPEGRKALSYNFMELPDDVVENILKLGYDPNTLLGRYPLIYHCGADLAKAELLFKYGADITKRYHGILPEQSVDNGLVVQIFLVAMREKLEREYLTKVWETMRNHPYFDKHTIRDIRKYTLTRSPPRRYD